MVNPEIPLLGLLNLSAEYKERHEGLRRAIGAQKMVNISTTWGRRGRDQFSSCSCPWIWSPLEQFCFDNQLLLDPSLSQEVGVKTPETDFCNQHCGDERELTEGMSSKVLAPAPGRRELGMIWIAHLTSWSFIWEHESDFPGSHSPCQSQTFLKLYPLRSQLFYVLLMDFFFLRYNSEHAQGTHIPHNPPSVRTTPSSCSHERYLFTNRII